MIKKLCKAKLSKKKQYKVITRGEVNVTVEQTGSKFKKRLHLNTDLDVNNHGNSQSFGSLIKSAVAECAHERYVHTHACVLESHMHMHMHG